MDLCDCDVEFGDVESDVEGYRAAGYDGVDFGGEGYGGAETEFQVYVEVATGGVEGGGGQGCFVAGGLLVCLDGGLRGKESGRTSQVMSSFWGV